jgi:hypothetical protein
MRCWRAAHGIHIQANLFNHDKICRPVFDLSHRRDRAQEIAIFQDLLWLQGHAASGTRKLQAGSDWRILKREEARGTGMGDEVTIGPIGIVSGLPNESW